MDLKDVVNGAIGPFPDNCAGYMNPPTQGIGYIAALKLSLGAVVADMDDGLEAIVSYDRAEAADAYIGQINMLTASSFCGLNGAVWGYDLARADGLHDGRSQPRMTLERHDGALVPIWSMMPLLDAGYRLFGSRDQRRFDPLPGAMVVCANKSWKINPKVETLIWCALALAIPEDRNVAANLFIEDGSDTESTGVKPLENIERNIAKSILRCGRDQGVRYKEIFVECKIQRITHGTVGCALACVPYVTLPTAAIPPGKPPSSLIDMTIGDWEQALGLQPLPPYSAE